jgi:hypothetical protein
MNKKILLSLFVVLLVAISLGSVSAEDATDVVAADDVDDVVAIDETPEVLSTNYTPASDSVEDVQIAVDSAVNPGDTVDLSGYAEYDFTNKTVTISHDGVIIDGKGTTTIKGYGDGNGIFAIKAKQVTITGITFINTNPKNNFTYGGTVAGDAISASAADGGLVSGCEFNNFSSGVKVMSTTGFTIEDSTFNGGYTTVLKNDPSVNKEQGTKALNIYKQSQEISVINNTFVGPMLDAVSIAQGSGSNLVLNNTFIGNAYSIYFGGASTEGTVIKGNRFIKCGAFNDTIADFNMSSLPIISTEKSSNDIIIEDNIFEVINGSILIAAESGNEAHGDPTEISNFAIIGNNVTKADDEVNASSVMLLHILGRGTQITVTSPITVKDNAIVDGMTMVGIYLGQNKFNKEEILTTTEDVTLNGIINNDTLKVKDIQEKVDNAHAGDVVYINEYALYDFADKTVTINNDGITIDGNGTTVIKGYGNGNGIFAIKAKNVTITGITFIDTNPDNNFTYGGTVAGVAISASAADGGSVSECAFYDFSSGVQVMSTTGFTIEDSRFVGGYTTVLKNDPTVNKERGTKALNIYKQSQEIKVINNTFEGPMLDAVSIAQGSGSNLVYHNSFIGNAYSIYFGGASTEGTIIEDNTFVNCGTFNDTATGFYMDSLPVISTEKSSNDITIIDNTFKAIDNNILIAAESGNEAHGDPTEISNFTIIDNKVIKANNEVNASSVMLLHILGRGDQLNVTTPITVVNNTIEDGMKMVGIYFGQNKFNQEEYLTTTEDIILSGVISKDNGTDNGTANGTDNSTSGNGTAPVNPGNSSNTAPAAPATTSTPAKKTVKITAKKKTFKAKSKKKKYTVTLKVNGKALKKVKVTLKIKGKTYKATTNSKGKATFNLKKLTKKGKYTAVIKFAGSSAYKAATKKVKITIK